MSESHRIYTTRSEHVDALRFGLQEAQRVGCRELCCVDTSYADWPIGERALLDTLSRWAQPHRRLTMLALDFDGIARRQPLFVEWRRRWSHIVECRQVEELEAGDMPSLLLAPGVVTVRLFDRAQWRGSVSTETADAAHARELFDAISQRSTEAFPATTLGL